MKRVIIIWTRMENCGTRNWPKDVYWCYSLFSVHGWSRGSPVSGWRRFPTFGQHLRTQSPDHVEGSAMHRRRQIFPQRNHQWSWMVHCYRYYLQLVHTWCTYGTYSWQFLFLLIDALESVGFDPPAHSNSVLFAFRHFKSNADFNHLIIQNCAPIPTPLR